MKYMGSKNRIAKHILPIILQGRGKDEVYVEPFVGGANMIDKVGGERIGADINEYLIALLQEMTEENYFSPMIDEDKYNHIKNNKDQYHKRIVGYAGTQLSFGAKWFGGYRRDQKGVRNYSNEAIRNVNKQSEKIKDVKFICSSYDELELLPNSLVYCDPPYAETTKYKDVFDHGKFWQWVRDKGKEGHRIFVSEYSAPDDFECIWEMEVKTLLDKNPRDTKRIERLFIQETHMEVHNK